jgi:hypothetical protein
MTAHDVLALSLTLSPRVFFYCMAPLGVLLITWALRSPEVRRISGFRAKLRALASKYGEGPYEEARAFVIGIFFIVIGVMGIMSCRA